MTSLKVLISGGGIAGSSLAFLLSKLGHNVTVIERFPTLRASGLQVDLRGHGIEVLKRMGLEEAFRSMAAPEQGMQVVDSKGRRRAFFPANKTGSGKQSFTSEFEIMRGDLVRLLHDASSKHGTRFIFGTSIEGFEEGDSDVEVRFTNGKTERYDLLVGADGVQSRTRKMMQGSDTKDGFHGLGVYVSYFRIPRPMQPGEEFVSTLYMAPGSRGIMTRRHSPDAIQVYMGGNDFSERIMKAGGRGDVGEQKKALQETMTGAGWQTEEILESLKNDVDDSDFYCEHMGIVKLDSWSKGRVVLVGDAAYCPSANTGQGVTASIVGVYILAGEIAKHCGCVAERKEAAKDGLETALKTYEHIFRPFITQLQTAVEKEGSGSMMLSSAFAIRVVNFMLGFASFFKVDIGKWMIKGEVKNWDLPKYTELRI